MDRRRYDTWGLLILLVGCCTVSASDVYRWTDAHGVVHFGTHPPAGVDAAAVGGPTDEPLPDGLESGATGDIHRWVDADGLVHYGDRPSSRTEIQTVDPGIGKRNVVTGLTAEERRRLQRFDERIERRLRARERARSQRAEAAERQRARCREIDGEIDALGERRRSGLTIAESNRVRNRMLELSRERIRDCR